MLWEEVYERESQKSPWPTCGFRKCADVFPRWSVNFHCIQGCRASTCERSGASRAELAANAFNSCAALRRQPTCGLVRYVWGAGRASCWGESSAASLPCAEAKPRLQKCSVPTLFAHIAPRWRARPPPLAMQVALIVSVPAFACAVCLPCGLPWKKELFGCPG